MKINKQDLLYGVPFFAGLVLQIFAVELFRKTFVSSSFIAALYIMSGVLGFILFRKKLTEQKTGKPLGNILSLLYCMPCFGGTLCWLFLVLNTLPSNTPIKRAVYPVEETGILGKYHEPFFVITDAGFKKEIVFNKNEVQLMQDYKNIELVTYPGSLGFKVIASKKLLN